MLPIIEQGYAPLNPLEKEYRVPDLRPPISHHKD